MLVAYAMKERKVVDDRITAFSPKLVEDRWAMKEAGQP
jgi:hypothetical protein